MFLDFLPIWGLLLATIAVVALALEGGFRLGKRQQLLSGGKSEVSAAMVGATMGLLAFMLAFTFNGAAGRHDARKALVVEEANEIEKPWLRAGFLAEPYRSEIRGLLKNYVEVRVEAASAKMDLQAATRQSEALHAKMWALAEEVGRQNSASITNGLFVQALNEVIDLHLKRVTVTIRNRVPTPIWATLFVLMVVGMVMMGTQIGIGGKRHLGMEVALAIAFSVVLFVIADLDRPQEGLIDISQQAMEELQHTLNSR